METSEVGRRNWRQLAVFLLRTLSVTRCPLHIVPNLTSQDTSNIVNEMAGGARIQYAFIIKDKDKDNVHIIHHAYQENLINIYFMLVCFFSLYLLIIWNIYLRELSPSSSLFRNFFQSWNSNFEGVILLPLFMNNKTTSLLPTCFEGPFWEQNFKDRMLLLLLSSH